VLEVKRKWAFIPSGTSSDQYIRISLKKVEEVSPSVNRRYTLALEIPEDID
jgi:hypothetical protein